MNFEETEMRLVGMLLYPNDAVANIPPALAAEHFSDAWLGETAMRLIDFLRDGGHPQAYIQAQPKETRQILNGLISAAFMNLLGAGELSERIMENWRWREIRSIGAELASIPEGTATLDVIGTAQVTLEQMCSPEKKNRHSEREVVEAIFHSSRESLPAQKTGISKLDEAMGGGMYPGKAYGFIARKKIGKTIMACTISHNIQAKHLFICCEMGAQEVHERVLARRMDVFPSAFRTDTRKEPWFQSKLAECVVTAENHVIYHDAHGLTLDSLKRLLTAEVLKNKITGFILDYWQLVGGQRRGSNEREHLDDVAQWIATFCRKHKVWAFVLGQENQDGNTRGGEGMRLAFDQVYRLRRVGDDPSNPYAHLEMMETRYTPWLNVGDEHNPALIMKEKGPYFDAIY